MKKTANSMNKIAKVGLGVLVTAGIGFGGFKAYDSWAHRFRPATTLKESITPKKDLKDIEWYVDFNYDSMEMVGKAPAYEDTIRTAFGNVIKIANKYVIFRGDLPGNKVAFLYDKNKDGENDAVVAFTGSA